LTLTLSIGMKDMAKKNAIIKKMLAVEGLGSTTTICTDKTGTLTRNEMTVKQLYADGKEMDVEGTGYIPRGRITYKQQSVDPEEEDTLDLMLKTGTLCNNAQLQVEEGNYDILGEPTEAALITLSEKEDTRKKS